MDKNKLFTLSPNPQYFLVWQVEGKELAHLVVTLDGDVAALIEQ